MNFVNELKRRSVFKVGAAYLVVAWLLAQIVSVLTTPLQLPIWFSTVVIVFLAIGFPVALLFAWAYELTPEGLKRVPEKTPDHLAVPIAVRDARKESNDPEATAEKIASIHPDRLSALRDFTWVRSAALPKALAPTVGRDEELATLRHNLEQSRQGAGRVVLVTGEPGIGKTQMLRAFSDEASDAGATVLFGLCYEEEGAPSYFPWLQILQTAGEMADRPDLLATLTAETEELSSSESSAATPVNIRSGPNAIRHVMYHTAISRLLECMSGRFVVILFDNLHLADAPSLKLLEFLGRALADRTILVVATYQDIEITRAHPLFATLTTLGREAHVDRVRLSGLDRTEVQSIVTRALGQPANDQLIDEIYRHTDGNPFFVSEVVRSIAEELATGDEQRIEIRVPDGIHETIGRRLDRLSPACNDLLARASVIGRTFETRQLEKLASCSAIEVLSLLEEAIAAAIVQETDKLGHFQFTHALITETLYDELPMSRRVAIHHDVARVLEEMHADNIEPFLGQIARHYHRTARAGDFQKAIDTALAAARYAERIVAYEDAIDYYELALEMLSMDSRDRRSEEAELHLEIASAHIKIGVQYTTISRLLESALRLARESGNRRCFVEAACQYVFGTFPAPSQKMLDYLDEALRMIDTDDLVDKARLMARKAAVLDMLGNHREADVMVREAIDTAEMSGDSWARCDTYGWASIVLRSRPETLGERIQLAKESVKLALSITATDSEGYSGLGADWAANEARRWLLLNCQEAGDMTCVKTIVAEFDRSADKQAFFSLFVEGAKAFCALMEGRWAEARELIDRTYEVGRVIDSAGAEGVFGAQMFHLFRELGRLREVAPVLQRFDGDAGRPVWLGGLAILQVEVGNFEAARQTFDQVFETGIAKLPKDAVYLTSLAHLAEACAALGDGERAGELYRALLPYSGQMATHPTAVCLGPVDRLLGMLAHLLPRPKEAREYFTRALKLCESAQTEPWLAHTKYAYAQCLRDIGETAEADRLIGEATGIARKLGMGGLLGKIENVAAARPIMQDRRATT